MNTPRRPATTEFLIFIALTFVVTWALWAAAALLTSATMPAGARAAFFLPGIFAPGIVALWLNYRVLPAHSRTDLIGQIFLWQVPARWYVFAVAYMILAKLTAALVFRLATNEWPAFGTTPVVLLLIATLISTPVQAGEEIGWRGYALPRLAAALGWRMSSLLLGVIWGVWHLPLFFIAGADPYYGQSFVTFLLSVTALSVAMTFLYARTRGSLLLVMLMHAAANNMTGIVPAAGPATGQPFTLHAPLMAWLTCAVLWVAAGFILVRGLGRATALNAGESRRVQ